MFQQQPQFFSTLVNLPSDTQHSMTKRKVIIYPVECPSQYVKKSTSLSSTFGSSKLHSGVNWKLKLKSFDEKKY